MYRLILIEEHYITVSARSSSPEPGLLSVCKQIRDEARKLYYSENCFILSIEGYHLQPFIPWYRLLQQLGVDDHLRATSCIISDGQCRWSDLLSWCRAAHNGTMLEARRINDPQYVGLTTVVAMHRAVEVMSSRPWEEVEPVLMTFQPILLACGHVVDA